MPSVIASVSSGQKSARAQPVNLMSRVGKEAGSPSRTCHAATPEYPAATRTESSEENVTETPLKGMCWERTSERRTTDQRLTLWSSLVEARS